jgi:hypothetical protein
MYNNPAFQMFLMATVDRYWCERPPDRGLLTGADKMLIVSRHGHKPGAKASLEAKAIFCSMRQRYRRR